MLFTRQKSTKIITYNRKNVLVSLSKASESATSAAALLGDKASSSVSTGDTSVEIASGAVGTSREG